MDLINEVIRNYRDSEYMIFFESKKDEDLNNPFNRIIDNFREFRIMDHI